MMKVTTGLLYFALGFFVAWAVLVMATVQQGADSACAGLGDCFLKAQTFFAGLLAIGAAWIAYRGVARQIRATDEREEGRRRDEKKVLALTLSAEFHNIAALAVLNAKNIRRVKRESARDGEPIYVMSLKGYGFQLSKTMEGEMHRVGVLGAELAPLATKSIGYTALILGNFRALLAQVDPGNTKEEIEIEPDDVQQYVDNFTQIARTCLNTKRALIRFAGVLPPL